MAPMIRSAPSRIVLIILQFSSLFCLSLAETVYGQPVDIRSMADKSDMPMGGGGGAQSRNIYSQKNLSPHRMMHFGKRPISTPPPSILIPSLLQRSQLVDLPLYQSPMAIGDNGQRLGASSLDSPQMLVSYDPSEQVIEAFPASPAPGEENGVRQLMDVVRDMLELNRQQQQLKEFARKIQRQQRPDAIKFMKLIGADEAEDTQYGELAPETGKQDAQEGEQVGEGNGGKEEQAQLDGKTQLQDQPIKVVNRSLPPMIRGNALPTITNAHINSMLFGRHLSEQPATLIGLSNYIKKAEPQKMRFMHFG